ncbi:hypothetical protein [Desulfosporosinus sp. FKB]|uniref:hypothetical protein n=1 Tax=Desulfosporosinus sp. FKB TaxID=1969835 RepID=UPI000B4A5300|nr:hypothetical protein [Desulfosporosinus sp. FKB]
MKIEKKEKIEIIILIFFVFLGLLYAYISFAFLPEWIIIQKSKSQLKAQQEYYQKLLTYQKNKSQLQLDINELKSKVTQLNSQVPNGLDKPQIMVQLYNLSKQHAVIPQKITFEKTQAKSSFETIGISFSCDGKSDDIQAMIHELQFGKTQRMAINSINLTISEGTMHAELKLLTYIDKAISNDQTPKPSFMSSSPKVSSSEK